MDAARYAGFEATRHLLAAGHRRIAYVDFTRGAHYSSSDRQHGYERAMREAGLSPVRIGAHADLLAGRVVPTLRHALLREGRPTAMLCYGEEFAQLALIAAAGAQLRVPGDLSLMVFCDHVLFRHELMIATMILPQHTVGRASVDMLLAKIQAPSRPVAAHVVAFQFDPGRTIAPPPGD